MIKQNILEHLRTLKQEHLAAGLEALPLSEQEIFFKQLCKYPFSLLEEQRKAIFSSPSAKEITPLSNFSYAGNQEDEKRGWRLLEEGKGACLILAGGQGTRLNYPTSKGFFPLSLVKRKSLFQLFFEKTLFASKKAGRPLSLAIMTSLPNHQEIVAFIEDHHYFGLPKDQVDFCMQKSVPFLNDEGQWILESPGKLAEGPDGNGDALALLVQSGVLDKWVSLGVEQVNVILIDNPLADPFDAELFGFHQKSKTDVTIKAVPRSHPEEKVGVLGIKGQKISVIEYSELPKEQAIKRDEKRELAFPLANISLYCFHVEFILHVAENACSLPWHAVRKKTPWGQEIWKCEKFIFDVLDQAVKTNVLVYPRERCFAPLKNLTGEASVEEVQRALFQLDCRIYSEVSGLQAKKERFELSQAFHYPTSLLLNKWKGKALPFETDYISE